MGDLMSEINFSLSLLIFAPFHRLCKPARARISIHVCVYTYHPSIHCIQTPQTGLYMYIRPLPVRRADFSFVGFPSQKPKLSVTRWIGLDYDPLNQMNHH